MLSLLPVPHERELGHEQLWDSEVRVPTWILRIWRTVVHAVPAERKIRVRLRYGRDAAAVGEAGVVC